MVLSVLTFGLSHKKVMKIFWSREKVNSVGERRECLEQCPWGMWRDGSGTQLEWYSGCGVSPSPSLEIGMKVERVFAGAGTQVAMHVEGCGRALLSVAPSR